MANYIVTGDRKHLLPLDPFRQLRIVNPVQFLAEVKEHPRDDPALP